MFVFGGHYYYSNSSQPSSTQLNLFSLDSQPVYSAVPRTTFVTTAPYLSPSFEVSQIASPIFPLYGFYCFRPFSTLP